MARHNGCVTRSRTALSLCLALLAALLVAGPATGGANEPAPFAITGRLLQPDGTPAAGVSVTARGEENDGDRLEQLLLAFTGTFRCQAGACTSGSEGRTGSDGRFRLPLKQSAVRDGPELRDVLVEAALPAPDGAGPRIRVRTKVAQAVHDVGDVRFWAPRLAMPTRPDGFVLDFSPYPPPVADVRYRAVVVDQAVGDLVEYPKVKAGDVLNRDALEDRPARVALAALSHPIGRPDLLVTSTAPQPTAPPGRTSLARGQACNVTLGTFPVGVRRPCWATDGRSGASISRLPESCRVVPDDLIPDYRVERCVRAPVSAVTVDLGRIQTLASVVLRWSDEVPPEQVVVELSDDGRSWRKWTAYLPSGERKPARYTGGTTQARWVRVRPDPEDYRRQVEQPAQEREVDFDTGLVQSPGEPGRRPRNRPDPRAEAQPWDGSLLGLEELVLLGDLPPPAAAPQTSRGGDTAARAPAAEGPVAPPAPILLALVLLATAGTGHVVLRTRVPTADGPPSAHAGAVRTGAGVWQAPPTAPSGSRHQAPWQAEPPFGGPAAAPRGRARWPWFTAAGTVLMLVAVSCVSAGPGGGQIAGQRPPVVDVEPVVVRPLPASASPVAVVEAALAYAAEDDRSAGGQKVCGLLVEAQRSGCFFPTFSPPSTKEGVSLVTQTADRALVRYGTFIDEPLVVRLQRTPSGWELQELPGPFPPSDCVTAALARSRDPFACPS